MTHDPDWSPEDRSTWCSGVEWEWARLKATKKPSVPAGPHPGSLEARLSGEFAASGLRAYSNPLGATETLEILQIGVEYATKVIGIMAQPVRDGIGRVPLSSTGRAQKLLDNVFQTVFRSKHDAPSLNDAEYGAFLEWHKKEHRGDRSAAWMATLPLCVASTALAMGWWRACRPHVADRIKEAERVFEASPSHFLQDEPVHVKAAQYIYDVRRAFLLSIGLDETTLGHADRGNPRTGLRSEMPLDFSEILGKGHGATIDRLWSLVPDTVPLRWECVTAKRSGGHLLPQLRELVSIVRSLECTNLYLPSSMRILEALPQPSIERLTARLDGPKFYTVKDLVQRMGERGWLTTRPLKLRPHGRMILESWRADQTAVLQS